MRICKKMKLMGLGVLVILSLCVCKFCIENNKHNQRENDNLQDYDNPITQQLVVITDFLQNWEGDEEFGKDDEIAYNYTVTDLNQNGKMELIIAICQGSGIYTYSYFWEMNNEYDRLQPCSYPGKSNPSEMDVIKETVSVCYNEKDEVYYYLFDDVIRSGTYGVSWNMRAVSLENKTIKEMNLYRKDMTIEEEQETYCYYDGMGNIISEEEYKKLVEQKVSACDVLDATIHWEKNTIEQWKAMDRQELQDKLTISYEGFTIK